MSNVFSMVLHGFIWFYHLKAPFSSRSSLAVRLLPAPSPLGGPEVLPTAHRGRGGGVAKVVGVGYRRNFMNVLVACGMSTSLSSAPLSLG